MNEQSTETTPKERVVAEMAELGLTIESSFVPWSQSRNRGEKHRSLNWQVTVKHQGRAVLTTDYSAGEAHCPAYKRLKLGQIWNGRRTVAQDEAIQYETEHGRAWNDVNAGLGKHINPDPVDVMVSLAWDADVLDYPTFEEWAVNYGYDEDSRKAEKQYRACLDIALKLRSAIGENGIDAIRAAAVDY